MIEDFGFEFDVVIGESGRPALIPVASVRHPKQGQTLPGPRCRRKLPFALYHWAPTSRRASIRKHGLQIGRKHVAHSPGWQAGYLCFSDCPAYAWALSGDTLPPRAWDLWLVRSCDIPDLRYREDHKGLTPAEYRTNRNIQPQALWFVASRGRQEVDAERRRNPRKQDAPGPDNAPPV